MNKLKTTFGLSVALLFSSATMSCSGSDNGTVERRHETAFENVVPEMPPLAVPGDIITCMMITDPETLESAKIVNAGQELSEFFEGSNPSEIEAASRYGVAECSLSLNNALTSKFGTVVEVLNIPEEFSCTTWQPVFQEGEEYTQETPTNRIGLVCVDTTMLFGSDPQAGGAI